VSDDEDESVKLAATRVAKDLKSLSGQTVTIVNELPEAGNVIVVGTMGKLNKIEALKSDGQIDLSDLDGIWEGFVQQTLSASNKTDLNLFMIAGSDNRGAVYGLFDMIEKAGVSPWAWWADVPIQPADTLSIEPGRVMDAPAVKYRGIFLNDENPALYGWVLENYGAFNADFYDRVFELILRNKGNYIWPAMWGKAIYDDDPQNKVTAARNGIILGTSHHEPLMRAHIEWDRYGDGAWDYSQNAENLNDFWRGGMERIGEEDVLVTIGMRGDGDEAMSEGTAIDLLENIVADQRQIIKEVTEKPAAETPQVWALYKEVQDYYDQGMKVPEDVLLLFSDDNWGQLRRLPELGAEREGGYGIYYHFDYVGDVRNYKWINTTQIERVWDQMNISRQFGADDLWIVNVGDLKPLELPIDFFLDYAWDPEEWPLERLPQFTTNWATQQFGPKYAKEIAGFVDLYTKYNSRRKPELLDQNTYSLTDYDEFKAVVDDYKALLRQVEAVRSKLAPEYLDAYNQLVWYPAAASANLNEMYFAAARNKLYAEQGRKSTNAMAELTKDLFAQDAEITRFYHEDIADGKWNHFGSQTHIGYTYWQQPEAQSMPSVTEIDLPESGKLGVSVSGTATAAFDGADLSLLGFDSLNDQSRYIEIFNTGKSAQIFSLFSSEDWVILDQVKGSVEEQTRVNISIDWDKFSADGAPAQGLIQVLSAGGAVISTVNLTAYKTNQTEQSLGYFPNANRIAIPADAPTCRRAPDDAEWKIIPNLGLEGSAISLMPATYSDFDADIPSLNYDFQILEPGDYEVQVYLSPTLDFNNSGAVDFAVSVDEGAPQTQSFNMNPHTPDWNEAVSHNALVGKSTVTITKTGQHTVSLMPLDPGLVFQKIVITKGEAPESYFGPPVSQYIGNKRECAAL